MKEKMALAQLKLDQIKKHQTLETEEQELMEAEMEVEKAILSFQIVSSWKIKTPVP